MSDQFFTPPYTVEGISYRNKNKNTMNGAMSGDPPSVTTVGVGKGLDANRYATKKTLAQGMLDIALLTANASQLKYVLTLGSNHEFYTAMLALIITSLILQVVVGILFMINGMMNINDPEQQKAANILNNINVVFVFIISVDNVIISSFGIENMNIHTPGVPIKLNGSSIK